MKPIVNGSRKLIVVGQGYVGLPLAMRGVEVGYDVVGFDLAEGRIDAFVGAYAIVRAQAENGKVRILALTNRTRAPNLNIPTVIEAGVPGLAFDGLVGLFGPQSMPIELRERIASDIKIVAQDPEVVAKLTATGSVIAPGTSAEFAKATEEQRAQVDAVGRTLGVKPAK